MLSSMQVRRSTICFLSFACSMIHAYSGQFHNCSSICHQVYCLTQQHSMFSCILLESTDVVFSKLFFNVIMNKLHKNGTDGHCQSCRENQSCRDLTFSVWQENRNLYAKMATVHPVCVYFLIQ